MKKNESRGTFLEQLMQFKGQCFLPLVLLSHEQPDGIIYAFAPSTDEKIHFLRFSSRRQGVILNNPCLIFLPIE